MLKPRKTLAFFLALFVGLEPVYPAYALRNEQVQQNKAGAEELGDRLKKNVRLNVERLEDRTVPSVVGGSAVVQKPDLLDVPAQEAPSPVALDVVRADTNQTILLADLPQAGQNFLKLAHPVTDWRVGDRLKFVGASDGADQQLKIRSISRDGLTITLEQPLKSTPNPSPGAALSVRNLSSQDRVLVAGFGLSGKVSAATPLANDSVSKTASTLPLPVVAQASQDSSPKGPVLSGTTGAREDEASTREEHQPNLPDDTQLLDLVLQIPSLARTESDGLVVAADNTPIPTHGVSSQPLPVPSEEGTPPMPVVEGKRSTDLSAAAVVTGVVALSVAAGVVAKSADPEKTPDAKGTPSSKGGQQDGKVPARRLGRGWLPSPWVGLAATILLGVSSALLMFSDSDKSSLVQSNPVVVPEAPKLSEKVVEVKPVEEVKPAKAISSEKPVPPLVVSEAKPTGEDPHALAAYAKPIQLPALPLPGEARLAPGSAVFPGNAKEGAAASGAAAKPAQRSITPAGEAKLFPLLGRADQYEGKGGRIYQPNTDSANQRLELLTRKGLLPRGAYTPRIETAEQGTDYAWAGYFLNFNTPSAQSSLVIVASGETVIRVEENKWLSIPALRRVMIHWDQATGRVSIPDGPGVLLDHLPAAPAQGPAAVVKGVADSNLAGSATVLTSERPVELAAVKQAGGLTLGEVRGGPGPVVGVPPPPPLQVQSAPVVSNIAQTRKAQADQFGAVARRVAPQVDVIENHAKIQSQLWWQKATSWVEYRDALQTLQKLPILRVEGKILELYRQAWETTDPAEVDRLAKEIRKAVDAHFHAQENEAAGLLRVRENDTKIANRIYASFPAPTYFNDLTRAQISEQMTRIHLERIQTLRSMLPDLYLLGSSLPLPDGLTGGDSLLQILRSIPTPQPKGEDAFPAPKEARAAFGRVVRKMAAILGHRADLLEQENRLLSLNRGIVAALQREGAVGRSEGKPALRLPGKRFEVLKAEIARVNAQRAVLLTLDPDYALLQAALSTFDPYQFSALPVAKIAERAMQAANEKHRNAVLALQAAQKDELDSNAQILNNIPSSAISPQERYRASIKAMAEGSELKLRQADRDQQDHIRALGLPPSLVGSPSATDIERVLRIISPGGEFTTPTASSSGYQGEFSGGDDSSGGTAMRGAGPGVTVLPNGRGKGGVIESGLKSGTAIPFFQLSPEQRNPSFAADSRSVLSLLARGLPEPLSNKEAKLHAAAIKESQKDQIKNRIAKLGARIGVLEDTYERAKAADGDTPGSATAWNDPENFLAGIPNQIAELRADQDLWRVELKILNKGDPLLQIESNNAIQKFWNARLNSVVHHRDFLIRYIGDAEGKGFESPQKLNKYRDDAEELRAEGIRVQAKIAENNRRLARGDPENGVIPVLPLPDSPASAGLPDARALLRAVEQGGLPKAQVAPVRTKEGYSSAFVREGVAVLPPPTWVVQDKANENRFWESTGVQFGKIPSGWPNAGRYTVLPRLGLIDVDAGHSIEGLLPQDDGSLTQVLAEFSGPVRDRFLEGGLYWVSGAPNKDSISPWAVEIVSLARMDASGEPVEPDLTRFAVIYPIYRMALVGHRYERRMVGARVEFAQRSRVDEILADRRDKRVSPLAFDGKDNQGRGYLDSANLFYFQKGSKSTGPLPFWATVRGRAFAQFELKEGNEKQPVIVDYIQKSIRPLQGGAPAGKKLGDARRGPVLHDFSGTWGANGEAMPLTASARKEWDRWDEMLARKELDGVVVLSSAPAETELGGAHAFVERSLLEGMDLGNFVRSAAAAGVAQENLHIVESYDWSGTRVLGEVEDLLSRGEQVVMVVGPDYREPVRARFFAAGAEEGLPRPSVAVLETGVLNPAQLLIILKGAFLKQSMHEFFPVAAGAEEDRSSQALVYRRAA